MVNRLIAGILLIALLGCGVWFARARVPDGHDALLLRGNQPRLLTSDGWAAPWSARQGVDSVLTLTLISAEDPGYRVYTSDGLEVEAELSLSLRTRFSDWLVALREDPTWDPQHVADQQLRTAVRSFAAETSPERLLAISIPDPGLQARLASVDGGLPAVELHLVSVTFRQPGVDQQRGAQLRATQTQRRILLIGVDAADPVILERLMAAGDLPHFSELARTGLLARLDSLTPLLSPLIWTTMATGVSPERHGILDFVKRSETGALVPVESTDRRVPAVWNVASMFGKQTAVVGWLATFPAEDILGSMITDRLGFLPFTAGATQDATRPGLVWPPTLLDDAQTRRVGPHQLDPALIRSFVDVSDDSLRAFLEPGFRRGELVNNLAHTLAAAQTTEQQSAWLWTSTQPDLGLFYFEMIDAVGHLFMPYAPPRLPWIAEAEVVKYGRAIDAAYRLQDAMLGRLMALADDSTLVVVVSDHGFKSGEARPRESSTMEGAAAARWHTPQGIVMLRGPGVITDAPLDAPRVHDLTPTLLAYLGIAPPGNLEGRVWTEAFSFVLPMPSQDTPQTAPLEASSTPTHATALLNLGLRQLQGNDLDAAIASFQAAKNLDPSQLPPRINLAQAWQRAGRHEEALDELRAVVEQDPSYPLGWMSLGLCYLEVGAVDEAISALHRATELEPRDPRILRNLGFAQMEAGQFPAAETTFTRVVGLEESAAGQFGLGAARLQLGKLPAAEEALTRALELDPSHAGARSALDALRAHR